MTLKELDLWFRSTLAVDQFEKIDRGMNGVQVGDLQKEIKKIAFAVDACMESFRRASAWGADLLVVHHGIFWGREFPITGTEWDRVGFMCRNNLALYALHLPLDQHPEFGNNICLARELGLTEIAPFGDHKGTKIGWKGRLTSPLKIDEVIVALFGEARATLGRLPFGVDDIHTVGIVSGGATEHVFQAISEGLDLFITGDASHEIYHRCQEARINVIFGGHYQTETWGVSQLAKRVTQDIGLETCFIDLPTGL